MVCPMRGSGSDIGAILGRDRSQVNEGGARISRRSGGREGKNPARLKEAATTARKVQACGMRGLLVKCRCGTIRGGSKGAREIIALRGGQRCAEGFISRLFSLRH